MTNTRTTPHPIPEAVAEQVAARFKLLGEPMRLRLLDVLRDGERTVSDLQQAIGASQQNVSKHMGVLNRGGLVQRTQRGSCVYYQVADPTVFAPCDVVCGTLPQFETTNSTKESA